MKYGLLSTSLLAASLSVAQSQQQLRSSTTTIQMRNDMSMNPDYDFAKEHGIDPEAEFDLMVKHGVKIEDGSLQANSFQGAIELTQVEEGSDREQQLLDLCGTVEGLFAGRVDCDCQPRLGLGLVEFDCESNTPQKINMFEYYPSFFGTFTFRIFAMTYDFKAGVCADDFNFFSEDLGFVINLRNFCISMGYKVAVTMDGGSTTVDSAITECNFIGGVIATCDFCTPCTDGNGNPGLTLSCTPGSLDIGNVGTLPCIPVSLPFTRADRGATPAKLIDGLVKSNAFDGAVEAAEKQALEDLAEEEEEEEEEEEPPRGRQPTEPEDEEEDEEDPTEDEEEDEEPDAPRRDRGDLNDLRQRKDDEREQNNRPWWQVWD